MGKTVMGNPSVVDAPIPHSRASYVDVDTLKNAEGLIVVISQRRSRGVFTFGLFKVFERDGRVERTSFIPDHMAKSAGDLIELAVKRIEAIKASGKYPFQIDESAGRDRT